MRKIINKKENNIHTKGLKFKYKKAAAALSFILFGSLLFAGCANNTALTSQNNNYNSEKMSLQ